MLQALEIHRSGALGDVPLQKHVATLAAVAETKHFKALGQALRQRYPGQVA
jgi:hypothetical protein